MNNDRLKFRVWDENAQQYDPNIKFYFLNSDGNLLEQSEFFQHGAFKLYPAKSKIAERCTGLQDKNGNLIYQGDIIQFTHKRGYFTDKGDIRIIEFSTFRFCGFGWRSRPENNVEFALTENAAKKCVIIGNIHEQK